jgi:hypothetical protein
MITLYDFHDSYIPIKREGKQDPYEKEMVSYHKEKKEVL